MFTHSKPTIKSLKERPITQSIVLVLSILMDVVKYLFRKKKTSLLTFYFERHPGKPHLIRLPLETTDTKSHFIKFNLLSLVN